MLNAGIIVFRHAEDKDGNGQNVIREIPSNVKIFDDKGNHVDSVTIQNMRLSSEGEDRAKLLGNILSSFIDSRMQVVTHVVVQDPRRNHEPTTSNPYDTIRFFLEVMGKLNIVKVHFVTTVNQTLEFVNNEISKGNSVMVCATKQWLWGDNNNVIDDNLILGSLKSSGETISFPEKGKTVYVFDNAYELTQYHVSGSSQVIVNAPK